MNNSLRLVYLHEESGKIVIVKKNRRKDCWVAELHTEKKERIFEFETLDKIKEMLKRKGYICITIEYKDNKDYTQTFKKYN